MLVKEFIQKLSKLPQDKQIGFETKCITNDGNIEVWETTYLYTRTRGETVWVRLEE